MSNTLLLSLLTHRYCQTFSIGFGSGAVGWQVQQGDVAWHPQAPAGLVPARAVTDQHGMGTGCDLAADLGQVQGHGVCMGVGAWTCLVA